MSLAFEPTTVGRYSLRNRVVMAPMTRNRAYGPGRGPTPLWRPTTPSEPAPG
jgi:N-ethylmaleimide reductase